MYDPADLSATIDPPPKDLVAFVERQVRTIGKCKGDDRRSEGRFLMAVPALVQPLTEDFEPIGEPFSVVTRDISQKGVGLVYSMRVDHRLLALRLTLADEEVNVAVRVRWCQELGPYYYVGGAFVAKLPLTDSE